MRCLASVSASGAMASVAPNFSAASRREATGSTAMIWEAPLSRAPWIAEIPTPPQPMTATDEPACTSAVLMAAPSPVVTPQPMSAAISNGTSSGMGTAHPAPTTTSSVKVPVPANPKTSPPGRLKLGVPAFMNPARHSSVWPRLQAGQIPQAGSQQSTTRSPWLRPVTPSPTSRISPAPSWPGTNGAGCGSTPFIAETSEWQSPVARTLILTLPGPKPTASTSSWTSSFSWPISCSTAARMVRLLTYGYFWWVSGV